MLKSEKEKHFMIIIHLLLVEKTHSYIIAIKKEPQLKITR